MASHFVGFILLKRNCSAKKILLLIESIHENMTNKKRRSKAFAVRQFYCDVISGKKNISPVHLPFKEQSLKFHYFRFPESFCMNIGSKVLCFFKLWSFV